MPNTNEARWYVVHTYSGYENKVATDLATMVESRKMGDLIVDIRIPTETVTEVKGDKVKEYERKIFPGYVLIKMIVTDESWYVVRNIRGVTGFVGPGSKPVPLTDEEVEKLNNMKSVSSEFKIGSPVKIIDGLLKGFEGTVQELDLKAKSVKILISMYGSEKTVELELGEIELIK